MKSSGFFVGLAICLVASTAVAYPSSVVFSPNGDALDQGKYSALGWGSVQLEPGAAAGQAWFGLEAGLLPHWDYGHSLHFGGLEVGGSVVLYKSTAKPILSAKLGLLTEEPDSWIPAVAVGIMEVSPALPSLSLSYLSASRTVGPFGRFTGGLGYRLGDPSQQQSTWPFTGTQWTGFAAWESPLAPGRLGLVADWLGGSSEIGSTYLGLVWHATDSATIGTGYYLSNIRTTQNDGLWFSFVFSGDVLGIRAPLGVQ